MRERLGGAEEIRLGDVGDVALSLSSRAVELDEVALARIEDPAAWVKGG